MDRDLHLLMLLHRQLEEARGFGIENPRLEYRDEPPALKVWVSGAEAVRDVQIGGYHHGETLMGDAGDRLRRMSAEGYVALEPDVERSRTGTLAITGRGLEKIRHRRAFESNIPRHLTMPEFSIIGGLHAGVMKLWRADWEGHAIRVKNRRYLRPSRRRSSANGQLEIGGQEITEYLEIDGRLAHVGLPRLPHTVRPLPENTKPSQPWRSKDLYGELRAVDGAHEVHAHIGKTAPFRAIGCLIAVDGVVIGGDVGKRFLT